MKSITMEVNKEDLYTLYHLIPLYCDSVGGGDIKRQLSNLYDHILYEKRYLVFEDRQELEVLKNISRSNDRSYTGDQKRFIEELRKVFNASEE
jgi:hypothetical protein